MGSTARRVKDIVEQADYALEEASTDAEREAAKRILRAAQDLLTASVNAGLDGSVSQDG